MKTFEKFKLEREKHEIAILICELGIDPDAYFEQILNEGMFKDFGNWWKKNVTAGNKVRLQSSYDQALQAIDNFEKNFKQVRGHISKGGAAYDAGSMAMDNTIPKIRASLETMKDRVAKMDQAAKASVMDTPYADIGGWQGDDPSLGQMAKQGWDKTKPARQAIGAKFGDMKKSWDNWKAQQSNQTYTGGSGI